MAKETSTSTTTRRSILAATAAAAAGAFSAPAVASLSNGAERVLVAWRGLVALQVEYERLADEMEEIEDGLPDWVKLPRVLVTTSADNRGEFWALTPEDIDGRFPEPPGEISPQVRAARNARRDALVAELQAVQCRAAAEREKAGWNWRDRRQDEIEVAEVEFHRTIDEARGDHPVVIVAKLWQALTFATQMFDDYPVRCIVGAISGLLTHLPADMRTAAEHITRGGRKDTMRDVWRWLAAAQIMAP